MSRKHTQRYSGSVRIIAGQWRGSKLPVVDAPGLRPTSDRARETLFNWIAPWLPGARCADLYAGSGSLGFEAASRGAAEVVLIESDRAAAGALNDTRMRLGAEAVSVLTQSVERFLDTVTQPFDIVFVDPPFEAVSTQQIQQLLTPALKRLLKPAGWLYLEQPREASVEKLFPDRQMFRQKMVGEVQINLFRGSE